MAIKKNEKIMIALIGAAAAYFLIDDPYRFIWKKPDPPPEAAADTAKAPPQAPGVPLGGAGPSAPAGSEPATPVVEAPKRPRRDPVVFANWGRDPFVQVQRHIDDAEMVAGMKLGGISVKGRDRYALINSRIVRVGDEIEGMIVERIDSDRVWLSKSGRSYTLTWGGGAQ
ncbi:MAG: hypothetical protein FJY67_02875 [Calditrichaeota bacterium]|nr:hypothetical protein [Calditrichota bacterium]